MTWFASSAAAASASLLPHGTCILWNRPLLIAYAASDLLIGLSYVVIAWSLWALARSMRNELPFSPMFVLFGVFILACGSSHFLDVWTLWIPSYWTAAGVKGVTAVASVMAAVMMPVVRPRVRATVRDARVAREREREADRATLLEEANAALAAQAAALQDANARLAAMLAERDRLEAELRQTQRLETIGRLAGGVAHDFNNLLTITFSTLELLRDELPASHPARDHVEEISKASESAAALTRRLLTVARRQPPADQVVSINAALVDTMALLRRVIPEHVSLDTHYAAAPLFVRIDPMQLGQAVMNLVLNALDAMTTGGKLVVCTREELVGPVARGGGRTPDAAPAWAVLELRDTGSGMSTELLAQVREPFFSTKQIGHGTGLGLTMVEGIVTAAGGLFMIDSTPGEGTTVTLWFPQAPAPLLAQPPEGANAESTREVAHGRILLVEDEDAVRLATRRLLTRAGYTVEEAVDGQDALERWLPRAREYALVLTDVRMPRLDGAELVRRLRAHDPHVRILLMSGYADDGARQAIAGMPLLEKPFTGPALLERVRAALTAASGGSVSSVIS